MPLKERNEQPNASQSLDVTSTAFNVTRDTGHMAFKHPAKIAHVLHMVNGDQPLTLAAGNSRKNHKFSDKKKKSLSCVHTYLG